MKLAFDIMNLQAPYRQYEELRRNSPIFYDPISQYWIVTTYPEVEQIMKDEANFSARLDRVNYSAFSPEALSLLCPINFQKLYGLSTTENPTHDKVKKILMPAWHQLYKKNLVPKIQELVVKHLEKLSVKKEFDVLAEVFDPLPANIVFTILGIEEDMIDKVKEWSKSRLKLTWGDRSEQVHHAGNIVKYWQFVGELLENKLQSPADDLPSHLLSYYVKGEISKHEIQLLCYGLLFSGHTTTSTFLAEALKTLLESGLWKRHVEEDIPFSQSVEEMLRLCPSAFTRRRVALHDVLIGNHQFKVGDEILLIIGSANRDETVFTEPDRAKIYRKNAKQHLSLGRGFHYCIGSKLVKLEYTVIMQELARAFPGLKLSQRNDYQYLKNISIRALEALLVEV